MKVRYVALALPLLLLTACSGKPVAAPVTTTVSAVSTTTQAVTHTVVSTVTSTFTIAPPYQTITLDPLTTVVITNEQKAAATATVTETETETETETAEAAPAPAAPAPAPAASGSSFPDGSYLIGSEMPAGNYTASGGSDTCVWLTYDSSHEPVTSGFGRIATVPASSYSFESSGCGTWSPTG